MSEEAIKQTFNPIPENDYHAGILSTMKTRSRRAFTSVCILHRAQNEIRQDILLRRRE